MATNKHPRQRLLGTLLLLALVNPMAACGDDNDDTSSEADLLGIGATCERDSDCAEFEVEDGGVQQLHCLTQFTGGYCGLADCLASVDCPSGSICVAHDDGTNYCFGSCIVKTECNENRGPNEEANCSSNFVWAVPSDDNGLKACIPPSSGI